MKKIKGIIILASFLLISLSSTSTEVKHCSARCYWSYTYYDCFCDAPGAQCGDVEYPSPYSVYSPCESCIIITPAKK